jgi:hypothetical protein
LRESHSELLTMLKEKKTISEAIAQLQSFYENVKEVRSTIHALDTAKK